MHWDRQTDGRTDGRTGGRTDGQRYITHPDLYGRTYLTEQRALNEHSRECAMRACKRNRTFRKTRSPPMCGCLHINHPSEDPHSGANWHFTTRQTAVREPQTVSQEQTNAPDARTYVLTNSYLQWYCSGVIGYTPKFYSTGTRIIMTPLFSVTVILKCRSKITFR